MNKVTTVVLDAEDVAEFRRRGYNLSGMLRDFMKSRLSTGVEEQSFNIEEAKEKIRLVEQAKEQEASEHDKRKLAALQAYQLNLRAQAELELQKEVYRASNKPYEELAESRQNMISLQNVMDLNLKGVGFSNMDDLRAWLETEGLIEHAEETN